ncbi:MAG: SPOR domain-containing protein [Magnetococcales bacterium]|nr:SPOR domain-containing protein [Magnetococcales bacterium]
MTPRYPTSSRFRRHQRSSPLPRVLLAAVVVCGGLYFLLRPGKAPDANQTAAVNSSQQEQPLRTAPPAVVEQKAENKAKPVVDNKPESKPLTLTEIKPPPPPAAKPPAPEKSETIGNRPLPAAELRTAAKAEVRAESKAEAKPESKPENRSGKQEIKLDIRPESRSESKPVETKAENKPSGKTDKSPDSKSESRESSKSDNKTESAGKKGGKTETAGKHKSDPVAESAKGPLLPQPHVDDENTFRPPPDTLAPKHREIEKELSFYRDLANKRLILPEEPAGKKIIPPFLAGANPASVSSKKPEAAAAKPVTEANKKTPDSKPATDNQTASGKKKSYQVQVAILTEQKNATAMADVLRRQGAPNPRISPVTYASGKTVFRVRLGPFPNQSDAAKAGQRWQNPGQPALITAVEE